MPTLKPQTLVVALGIAAPVLLSTTAQAQSLFEALFGRPIIQQNSSPFYAPAPAPGPFPTIEIEPHRRRSPEHRVATTPAPVMPEHAKPARASTDREIISNLMADSTLQKGDIVVFPSGPRVFRGSSGAARRASDFEDLRASRLVGETVRNTVLASTRGSASTQVAASAAPNSRTARRQAPADVTSTGSIAVSASASASDGKVDPVFRVDRRASSYPRASDWSEKWSPLFGPMLYATRKPAPIASSGSWTKLDRPVQNACPLTSTTTAGWNPTRAAATGRAVKIAPVMLRYRRAGPPIGSPRATASAMRAVTPDPVGERSICPSANTHTFVEGSSEPVGPIGQDRPVEKAEIGVVGMDDGDVGPDRLAQGRRARHDVRGGSLDGDPERRRIGEGVECSPIGEIVSHGPDPRHVDLPVHGQHEGRNAAKGNQTRLAVSTWTRTSTGPQGHCSTNSVTGSATGTLPVSTAQRAERQRRVTAHGAVALVVHEQHGEVGARDDRARPGCARTCRDGRAAPT